MMRYWFLKDAFRTILLGTVLACGVAHAADAKPPVDKDGRPLIRKLGTFDTTRFVENSLSKLF